MNKLVSVILPTYNGAGRIEKAIKSVLSQSYNNLEIIIIDDGSTDNTGEVVYELSKNDIRIKYFKNEKNLGIQKSLNRGLREAEGGYIARIDDDDEWIDKEKLQKQVEFLNNNQDYVLVGTGVVVDEKGGELFRYKLPEKDFNIKERLLGKNCFVHSSVLFRKDKVIEAGEYSESLETKHVEDYDLWLRLGTIGKLYNLPIYGVKFTLRDNSLSSVNKTEQFSKNIFLIKKYKGKYPRYISSLLRSYIRIFVYGFMIRTPLKFFIKKLIKFYKENF